MATIAIVLNTTYKLENREYSVALRVTHDRKPKYFSLSSLINNNNLSFQCNKENWRSAEKEDNGLGRFRKSVNGYKQLNEILETKHKLAQDILSNYDNLAIPFSFDRFVQDLKNNTQVKQVVEMVPVQAVVEPTITSITLHDYYSEQIRTLDEQLRAGMSGLYLENQRILDKFRPSALLTDVNFRFLESFEYWMRNVRGNKDTTISVKMRNLQRVINQAIEYKLFKQEDYPFGTKKYSVNKRLDHTTKKIAIHTDKIGKLKALELEPGSSLHFAQQIFLFSYYNRGMNFIDITYLKWSQISETHTDYRRRKTGGQFHISRNKYVDEILCYFKAAYQNADGYVFPIIDSCIHVTTKQQYTRKKTALKAVNDNLKKLAKMIGKPELKLTTNVGRHSYATGLKRSGANTSHITEALGHATQEQTQIYLAEFETGVIESWESKIFEL